MSTTTEGYERRTVIPRRVGYSALAIVLVMGMLLVMLVVVGLIGMQRLPTGIPVVGNCSWAISSACHDIAGERDAALKPLRWGVLDPGTVDKPRHVRSRVEKFRIL